MILNDLEIKAAILSGDIKISNWEGAEHVGPSSLDLHLDNKAFVLDKYKCEESGKRTLHLKDDMTEFYSKIDGWEEITLMPGEFYILSTVEKIKFPRNLAGFVQGRSSIARAGIQVHAAGFVDPGFEGTITLEVSNLTPFPITVPKHTRICQMVFATCNDAGIAYDERPDSKYQGQTGPVISRAEKDI